MRKNHCYNTTRLFSEPEEGSYTLIKFNTHFFDEATNTI